MVNNEKSHRTGDSGLCSSEEAADGLAESPVMQGECPDGEASHRDTDRGDTSTDAQGDGFETEDGVDAKMSKRKSKELSHRDIEKRRRDRINRSLWKLKDLIPSAMQKQENGKPAGSRSGRLEKAEVLELTVDYLLQIGGKCKAETGVDVLPDSHRKRPADAIQSNEVIAESAKEVYLAGFRDGVQHTTDAMVSASVLTAEEKSRLVANLDLANLCVPRIFLTHAKKRKRAASEHDITGCQSRSDSSSQSSHSLNRSSLASRERFGQPKAGDSSIANELAHGLGSSMSRQSVCGESTSRDSVVITDSSEQSGWSDESGEGSGSTDDRVGSSLSSEGSMQTPLSFTAHTHPESPFPNSLKAPEHASLVADAIVLPAYVLDADRTRYVPVVLPQSILLSSLLSSLKGGTLNSSSNHDIKNLHTEIKSSESGDSHVERNERNDLAALKGRRVTADEHDGKRIRVISSAMKRDMTSPRSRVEQSYNVSQQAHYDVSPNVPQRPAGVINRGHRTESSGSSPDWVSRDCKPWALNRQPISSSIMHDDALYNMQESLRHVSFASSSSHSVFKRGDSNRDLDYRELFMPGCPRPSESLFDYQTRYYPLTPGD